MPKEYPDLLSDVDPSEVEGINLEEGQVSTRVRNTLLRSSRPATKLDSPKLKFKGSKGRDFVPRWADENDEINLGVIAETSEDEIRAGTRNLGSKGIDELKTAVRRAASRGNQ